MKRILAAIVVAAWCTTALPAGAQPSTRTAAAEDLFRAGRELLAARRFHEACDKLDASEKLEPAVGTLFSLGECYAGQGRTASAWLAYRAAIALANDRSDRRSLAAEERAQAIEPLLSRLVVDVRDERVPLEALVRIGEDVFTRDALRAPIPVDPGVTTVAVSAPGYLTWSSRVSIAAAGATAHVEVPALERLPDAAQIGRERSRLATRRTLGEVLGAAGLVSLATGAVLGMQAAVKVRDANRACPQSDCANAGAVQESQTGRGLADAASVTLPVGAALLAAGAYFFFTSSAPRSPALGAEVSSDGARVRAVWSW